MKWIELNNVEYGECIVLGGKTQILMNDCGSTNKTLAGSDVKLDACFSSLTERYQRYLDRYFLLSHYHSNHLNGFRQICQTQKGYFNRVYIPCTPVSKKGIPVLLSYALYAYMFADGTADGSGNIDTLGMQIFDILMEDVGIDRIFTLKRGDIFNFDGVDYETLWPRQIEYPFPNELEYAVERLDLLFASPYLTGPAMKFRDRKKAFLQAYLNCCDAFSASGRQPPEKRHALINTLSNAFDALNELREPLLQTRQMHDARDIIENPVVTESYNRCTDSASIIYQNRREKSGSIEDILMTGDSTPEIIATIWEDLYNSYYVLKAPNHGTRTGYSSFWSEIGASHILISNGECDFGEGITQNYVKLSESIKHCTNNSCCKWFAASGSCCNRISHCYDQSSPGLSIKCSANNTGNNKKKVKPDCMIRVVNTDSTRACFCDN